MVSKSREETVVLSENEVFARLITLDGRPDSVIKTTERDDVLRAIPANRVFPFMERCERKFSIDFEEQVFGELVGIAVEDVPEQTLDAILKRGIFWQIRAEIRSGFSSMGKRGLAEWSKSDFQGAADWLRRNWKKVDDSGGLDRVCGFGRFCEEEAHRPRNG